MVYDSVHVFARGLEAATREGPELRIRYDNFELLKPFRIVRIYIIDSN